VRDPPSRQEGLSELENKRYFTNTLFLTQRPQKSDLCRPQRKRLAGEHGNHCRRRVFHSGKPEFNNWITLLAATQTNQIGNSQWLPITGVIWRMPLLRVVSASETSPLISNRGPRQDPLRNKTIGERK
jgi:hypothetical protein